MKTLLSALALTIVMAHQGYCQDIKNKEVPSVIKDSLSKNFSINDADWNKEGANYEASFEQKGNEISVLFDNGGNIIETEKEIKQDELPPSVHNVIKKEYAVYELEEIARIDANGTITYEVELEKGNESFDLIFDMGGKVLNKILKQEDKD